ncbi:MAG: type II toxin-antitoxin system HicB family antitoxin [Nanoarchaeota archaeon]
MDKIELDIVIYPEKIGKKQVYSINSVQFPNVVTQGDSIEEAKKMLREAILLYLESAPWENEKLAN